MRLTTLLLCGLAAALALSLAPPLIASFHAPVPVARFLMPILAFGPALILVAAAGAVVQEPNGMIGRPGWALAGLGLVTAIIWPTFALAQDASATTVNLGGLFGDLRSTIETLVAVVVAAILGLLTALLKKNLGVSIDGKMRDTLQSALMNGVHLGLDAVQTRADKTTFDVKSEIVAHGLDYVRQYAPAAVKHFGLGEDDLVAMLKAQLAKLQPAEMTAVAKVAGA